MEKQKQASLIERLESIPRDAVLVIEHDQFSTSFHPVGRLCHEAAAELRSRHPDDKGASMNTINDGGPAFPGQWYDFQPLTGEQVVREQWGGMSLRDYFAAKAMAALIAEYAQMSGPDIIAHVAYMMADAMLKAREAHND